MTTAWTKHSEVKIYAATKWNALNVSGGTGGVGVQAPFLNEAAFDNFIDTTLIPRAQSHINRFCKRDFDVDFPGAVPPAIQDVAARAAANMIQYMVSNKMGPLVHETHVPDLNPRSGGASQGPAGPAYPLDQALPIHGVYSLSFGQDC